MEISLRDVEKAFEALGWSYATTSDGQQLMTEFTDHMAPVRMVLNVENGSLVIKTLGVAEVSSHEMGQVLKLAKDLNVAPDGLMWSRDPDDDQAWCTSAQRMAGARLSTEWLSNEVDKVVLAVHALRTTLPRVRKRGSL